jgi:hypothetical protein
MYGADLTSKIAVRQIFVVLSINSINYLTIAITGRYEAIRCQISDGSQHPATLQSILRDFDDKYCLLNVFFLGSFEAEFLPDFGCVSACFTNWQLSKQSDT